jgi:uncharacterized protein (TIGR02145 family)
MSQQIKNKKFVIVSMVLFLVVGAFLFWNYSTNQIDVLATSDCVSSGTVTCTQFTNGLYTVNKYILSGSSTGTTSWTPPAGVTSVDYLVVGGGGGGGGSYYAGGGGAGGVITNTGLSVSGTMIIVVGAGGAGGTAGNNGGDGGFSQFGTTIGVNSDGKANGGGGGGTSIAGNPGNDGRPGGSGGGGSATSGVQEYGGAGNAGEGYDGGDGYTSTYYGAGGGGGAGGPGGDGHTDHGGNGGMGITETIPGLTLQVGGGGGGGIYLSNNVGQGAAGGGNGGGNFAATSASANSGSGGGGAERSGSTTGGNGGSGIIIVRYLTPTVSITSTTISTADADICTIVAGKIVCRSGQPITFNSVATGTNQVKLYICKDSACTNCGILSTSNCWAYSTSYADSNPSAIYDSSCYGGSCGTGECEFGTNNYWAKVCDGDGVCSNVIDSQGTPIFNCGDTVTFTYNGASVTYGTVTSQAGECWLDRNLGASRVATAYNDSSAYGDLFQWGRGVDGHQVRTSGTTATLSSSDTPGHANFIINNASLYDWRSPQNNNLWQGVSGTNNPCPTGWRLPTSTEWQAEITAGIINYTTAYNSSLKLTAAGDRLYYDASIQDAGSYVAYWSSSISGTNISHLNGASSSMIMNTNYRSFGFSVRCIRD